MIIEWAKRWNIPRAALDELLAGFGMIDQITPEPSKVAGWSEAAVSAQVRLEATRLGWRTWRNNVGVLTDDRGVPVRYGLANDTKQMNQHFKSSDLIGINPVVIGPHHIGCTIGQFVSLEVKHGNWKYRGDDHEKAQARWMGLIASMGGKAMFVSDPKQLTMRKQEVYTNER